MILALGWRSKGRRVVVSSGPALLLQQTLLLEFHTYPSVGGWACWRLMHIDPETRGSREFLELHSVRRACCPGSRLLSPLAA